MSEVLLTEQLDQAIELLLRDPGAPLAAADPQLAELLNLAVELRNLPRAEFKSHLGRELQEESSMSKAKAAEEGIDEPEDSGLRVITGTVTPYLVVPDVHAGIAF